jgi:mannose-1-phosphate guanylyltransferase
MKALVLIGGFGTRLRPLTYAVPKQLIPIAGKPILYHVLDLLPADIEEVVLATGYKADQIGRYVREHPPQFPTRTVEEAEPLGTGGGMRNAGGDMSDPFLFLNSDVIAQIDVTQLVAFHRDRGGVGAMTLVEVEDTRPYGVAALEPDDRIATFVEKPSPEDAPSHWINAGLQIWRRDVVQRVPPGRPVSWETEVVPLLLAEGIYGFRTNGFWEDAGTPERLLRAQRLLFDAGRGGKGALPSGAHGRGPVAAGPDCELRGASFGPYVSLGSGVRVEPGAHIENSVLMDGVEIGREASVRNAILGPRVRVGSGHTVRDIVLGEGAES